MLLDAVGHQAVIDVPGEAVGGAVGAGALNVEGVAAAFAYEQQRVLGNARGGSLHGRGCGAQSQQKETGDGGKNLHGNLKEKMVRAHGAPFVADRAYRLSPVRMRWLATMSTT